MTKNKSYSLAFILSLVAHAMIAMILSLEPLPPAPAAAPAPKLSEVELIDAESVVGPQKTKQVSQLEKGQIIEQSEQRLNDEKSDDARFLSRFDQKVIRQTQAQLNGKFKNTDQSSGDAKQQKMIGRTAPKSETKQAPSQDQSDDERQLLTSDDGIVIKGAKPKLKDLMPSFKPSLPASERQLEAQNDAQGGGQGPSATDDHLKDVATGMQTMLSTREFVYYSYYNRIKEKLRQYWEPKIREKMERIVSQGRQVASTTERVTRIIIILDGRGTLQRIQVVGASGVHDLDEAAVEAFRAAAPFPNPPKGIQESDGTIKIRWDFILEANARDVINRFENSMKTV